MTPPSTDHPGPADPAPGSAASHSPGRCAEVRRCPETLRYFAAVLSEAAPCQQRTERPNAGNGVAAPAGRVSQGSEIRLPRKRALPPSADERMESLSSNRRYGSSVNIQVPGWAGCGSGDVT